MDDLKKVAEPVVQADRPMTVGDFLAVANEGSSVEYRRVAGLKQGTTTVLKTVTSGDIIEWSEASEGEAKRTAGLRLIIKSVVDGEPGKDQGATGKTILDDTFIKVLKQIPHKDTERLIKDIVKLNGMTLKGDNATKND